MAGLRYAVRLTAGAERDLEVIYDYLAAHRSAEDAAALLDAILEKVGALENYPERGAVPKELAALGIGDFRQILHRHYRLIYRVIDREVFILLVADGRRDMQALLERRLLADEG